MQKIQQIIVMNCTHIETQMDEGHEIRVIYAVHFEHRSLSILHIYMKKHRGEREREVP